MAFDHLMPKPATRISTAWGSGIVEALNLLYDWLTSGQRDITANSVNAVYGSFSEQVLVKGRPVIKDGDPVTIYDIYDAAKSRIKEAIDESQSTLYLSLLYGKFNGMFMDAYGRVGVAIYDDRIGLAKSSDVAAVRDRLPSSLTTAGNLRAAVMEDTVGLARESTLSSILGRLDVALSTRASESTLGGIKSQTDKLTFDGSNRLYVNAAVVANPPNLDVALSTRASESTLTAVRDRLPSSLTTAGNLRIAVVEDTVGLAKSADVSAIQPRDIARWGGTALTGRDVTQDLAKLQNLDIALSTRASETTLSSIKAQTDKLTFDADNRLYVNATVVANPPNLDVALSTRASESTLAAVRDRLPSSLTSAGNLKTAIMEDTVGLAKSSDIAAVRDRLPASLTTDGNLKVAVLEDAVGLAKSSDISAVQPRNIAQWGGVALTGRDITQDVAKLSYLTFDEYNRLYVVDDKLLATLSALLTAAGNLRVSLQETTIKQPVDIQDHWSENVVLLPSAARTASGTGSDVDVGRFLYAEVCVDVTAVSGTNPVLNVYVEGKDRYTGKYKTLLSFENISSVQTLWGTISPLIFTLVRVRWTISGTNPSFTFSVSMEGKS
ncbi:MAG: hypothetical protein QXU62_08375 [Thermofilaceae archaeon]